MLDIALIGIPAVIAVLSVLIALFPPKTPGGTRLWASIVIALGIANLVCAIGQGNRQVRDTEQAKQASKRQQEKIDKLQGELQNTQHDLSLAREEVQAASKVIDQIEEISERTEKHVTQPKRGELTVTATDHAVSSKDILSEPFKIENTGDLPVQFCYSCRLVDVDAESGTGGRLRFLNSIVSRPDQPPVLLPGHDATTKVCTYPMESKFQLTDVPIKRAVVEILIVRRDLTAGRKPGSDWTPVAPRRFRAFKTSPLEDTLSWKPIGPHEGLDTAELLRADENERKSLTEAYTASRDEFFSLMIKYCKGRMSSARH